MKSYIFYSSSRMKPMLLHHPSSVFFFLFTFMIISTNIPTSLSADDFRYTNCTKNYSCGNIPNLNYPFWGGDKPEYCGQPNLKINCESNTPKFTVNGVKYRILDWDFTTQNLKVARDDMWNDLCASNYSNTNFDNTVFHFDDGLANATVLYNCTTPLTNQIPQMTCGVAGKLVYYTFRDSSYEPCTNVTVPVFGSQAGNTDPSQIPEEIKEGFGLKLEESSYDECDRCIDSGGQCGYDRKFVCFCKDGPNDTSCSNSGKASSKVGVGIGAAVGVVALVGIVVGVVCCCALWRKNKAKVDRKMMMKLLHEIGGKKKEKTFSEVEIFSFETIAAATQNFSAANKLGEGGFGPVYKGTFSDEQEVAIKRLSKGSGQGMIEFKNEANLMAKLQHTNLVKLLGLCIQREERIIVYEYMSNKSLDFFLFDSSRENLLDWKKRLNIIGGIAQGLLYLHKYSRLKVIHRDLKASNILLDEEMNPKISDFGMARIFGLRGLEENTNRVVGTYGYMSPEYAMSGIVSIKTDVFSFGVLLIEILSGKKNNSRYHSDSPLNLIGYAWQLWNEGRALDLKDAALNESSTENEVLRCIHIGLLCVQDQATDRPTMLDVVSFLSNDTIQLPIPKQPAFFINVAVEDQPELPNSREEYHTFNDVTVSSMYGR